MMMMKQGNPAHEKSVAGRRRLVNTSPPPEKKVEHIKKIAYY
jgi:hypothetical protein